MTAVILSISNWPPFHSPFTQQIFSMCQAQFFGAEDTDENPCLQGAYNLLGEDRQ